MLPGWQSLLNYIEGLSLEQRQQRERNIIRQMRANGLAYDPENLLADSGRPWELDLVPMLFEQASWDDLTTRIVVICVTWLMQMHSSPIRKRCQCTAVMLVAHRPVVGWWLTTSASIRQV